MYKSCFDGILSCLNGSSLLSSCFYPPSPSDSSHEIVITDKRDKALAKIESQLRCFNPEDTKDYQIAITMNPDKRGELRVSSHYDEFCTNKKYQCSKHSNQFRFILYKLPDIDSEEKDEFGSMLVESPPSLIVEVPDAKVVDASVSLLNNLAYRKKT